MVSSPDHSFSTDIVAAQAGPLRRAGHKTTLESSALWPGEAAKNAAPSLLAEEHYRGSFHSEALEKIWEQAGVFAAGRHAPATQRAYRSDIRLFFCWAQAHGCTVLPAAPEHVGLWLTEQAQKGLRWSSISRRQAAISWLHQQAGYPSPSTHPLVKNIMAGMVRKLGSAVHPKHPLQKSDLLKILAQIPETPRGIRDRAMLVTGFAGALRRSELMALRWQDCSWHHQGVILRIRRAKGDQLGAGSDIALLRGKTLCPVTMLKKWQDISLACHEGQEDLPIFCKIEQNGRLIPKSLHPYSFVRILKTYAAQAGFDPALFAGHSLRSGLLTEASLSGADVFALMELSRHKSVKTLARYIRRAKLFDQHPAQNIF